MTLAEYKDFIAAWCECRTMAEFSKRTGIDARTASNIAANLRRGNRSGKRIKVPLPLMSKATHDVSPPLSRSDWQELARHAEVCMAAREVKKYREVV